jgi:hypothetical protein
MARVARLQVKKGQHFVIDERLTAPQDRRAFERSCVAEVIGD